MIHDSVFIPATASMAVILATFLFTACNSGKPATGYAPVQAKALRFRARLFPGPGRARHREERPA